MALAIFPTAQTLAYSKRLSQRFNRRGSIQATGTVHRTLERSVRLHRQLQPHRLCHGHQGGQARIAAGGQGSIKTLPPDSSGAGNFGDAAAGFGAAAERAENMPPVSRAPSQGATESDGRLRGLRSSCAFARPRLIFRVPPGRTVAEFGAHRTKHFDHSQIYG